MNIELLGWSTSGVRSPDVNISFQSEGNQSPAHVTLIQMPNGTGKTTTLSLIKAAMTGEAERWNPEKIKSFRRPGEDTAKGRFILNLLIDERPLTFELTLNFESGTTEYRTTAPGSGGVSPGWNPPPNARRFLNPKFVKLFIFDGEFADRLLDARQSEAAEAIDALCQLYLLEDVKSKAEESWLRAVKDKTAKTTTGLTQRRQRVDTLKEAVQKTERAAEEAKKVLEGLELDAKDLQEKIDAHIGSHDSLKADLEAKEREESKYHKLVEETSSAVMEQIRQPHLLDKSFAGSLVQLKNHLDRLKLPASTSSQFFEELLEEPECICGRPLDEQARQIVKERAQLYLAEETSGVLNTLKDDITLHLMKDGGLTPDHLAKNITLLDSYITQKQQASTAVRALKAQVIDQGGEIIKGWRDELSDRNSKIADLKDLLQEIARKPLPIDDDNTRCLASLKRMLKDAEEKLAEITGTIDLHERTRILKEIVERALAKAHHDLRMLIVTECNKRLEKVLFRDPIRLEDVSRSLTLSGQEGASVGQTLSVGYTFLTTLLNRGQHQFPLVVDSPANPLSIEVRREVGKLVPSLCRQFVGFTISSERAGFLNALSETAKDVKYYTLFRKTPGTDYLLKNLPPSGAQEFGNSVLVEGKSYFESFDVENE